MKIISQLKSIKKLSFKSIFNLFNLAVFLLIISISRMVDYAPMELIKTSFILLSSYILFVYHYKRYNYSTEKKNVGSFKTKLINYSSKKDILALLLLVSWVVFFFIINTLLFNGYRHHDTVGYLEAPHINFQMWGTRFFPFAHQEFNFISHNLYVIRSLISLEFIACIYFLNKIIPLKYFWQRALSIILITLSPCFFISYIEIIVNDRNVIFFTILFVYNLMKFHKEQKFINLAAILIFANIAIYYKEPVFGFFAIFAVTSLLGKFFNKEFSFKYPFKSPIKFIMKYPIEIGLLILSSMFVVNYLLFTASLSGEGYASPTFNMSFLREDLTSLMFGLIIFIYILNIRYKLIKNSIHLPMLFGGFAYLILVLLNISIGITSLYYKCMFDITIALSLFFIISQIKVFYKLKFFIVCIFIIIAANSIKLNFNYYKYVTLYEIQSGSLENYFKNEKENIDIKKRIFTNYNSGYRERIFLINITKNIPIDNIEYYSPNACVPYNNDKKCKKGTLLSRYDYVIIYREMMSEKDFDDLNKNYNLEKISNYPKFLKAINKDIYIIKDYNYIKK